MVYREMLVKQETIVIFLTFSECWYLISLLFSFQLKMILETLSLFFHNGLTLD